jgi:hypothetical protein
LPGTIRPLYIYIYRERERERERERAKKKEQNKKNKKSIKRKEEGFSCLFLFTKLTIQNQKKINFPMPLHHKHCKEGTTVVTQFWPISF